MSKTTARTFLAAAVLLAVSAMIYIYGHRVAERQMIAAREELPPAMHNSYNLYYRQLETWEQAAGLTGLLAVFVSIAGAIIWERETKPLAQQSSILGLNQQAAGRNVRRAVPQNVVAFRSPGPAESNARLCEEDSLTPLERVIRGN